MQRGELPEDCVKAADERRATLDKVQSNARSLSEALQLPLPELPHDPEDERSGEAVVMGRAGAGEEEDFDENPFEDQDTRDFYEALPDIFELVPAVLLGEAAIAARAAAVAAAAAADSAGGEDAEQTETSEPQADAPKGTKEKASGQVSGAEAAARAAEEEAGWVEGDWEEEDDTPDQNAIERAKMEEFIMKLPKCQSRDTIDQAAQDFCYQNNKANRMMLARALVRVDRRQLGLIPYYARLIAILAPAMPDIPELVCDLLIRQSTYFRKVKSELNLEDKLRNVKFHGELVKFKIMKPLQCFRILQSCIEDFAFQNIELACSLFESCGRYLYRTKITHERTKAVLATMMRLRAAKNLDARLETMLENAYYVCRPAQQSQRAQKKVRPPLHEYIRYLLFSRLTKATLNEVAQQLRKIPWAECEPYLIKCLLKVQKGKYNQVYLSATLASSLRRFHDSLAVHLADDLLSELRQLLHAAEPTKQQRLLSLVKLLGELHNDLVVDAHVIFDTLYMLLSAGTDRTGPLPDPPNDCFRVRVVCTLLDTCGQHFDRGSLRKRLDLFLAHFQRYLLGKVRSNVSL